MGIDLKPFDALLFDLDGTLVNTMPLHGRAYSMAFETLGYHLREEDFLAHVGPPARIAIAAFASAAGMGQVDEAMIRTIHREKKRFFSRILAEQKPEALTASKLLGDQGRGKRMAVVSSGNREGVDAILRRMEWTELFDVVVSGDDTEQGKPAPDPYLQAATALHVPAARCLVFEDTEAGVHSATAAGMNVIDVTRPGAVVLASVDRERRANAQ
ncbi:HAD family hydrolase [Hyphomicrobium nitrativorans NL23]|uniref:HAD family hydrolase n=1 Tax=Hyphomicrobium nitrativorans NL23 TaxID=1029756 RepID=V5SD08_9HYPH|nr:HAD family phosphatase [Hyphomicrobium nitrativorans]AHB47824.1 HAD family hydrolase [Hyphomicrobium nitrativorans NL23]